MATGVFAARAAGRTDELGRGNSSEVAPFLTDLERCLKCGFCMATCPTYADSGLETDVARGRLDLISQRYAPEPPSSTARALADAGGLRPPSAASTSAAPDHDPQPYFQALFACLECGACVAACPAGVPVTEIISSARADWGQAHGLPWIKRVAIQGVLGHPTVLGVGGRLAAVGQGLLMRALPNSSAQQPRLSLPLVGRRVFPRLARRSLVAQLAHATPPAHPRQRVAFFPGCLISQAYTDVGLALHHVLAENDVEMVTPANWVCCGMPAQVHGAWKQARRQVQHNLEIMEELERAGVERILTACGSCGSQLRHHAADLFRTDPGLRARVERAGARVRDASEYLADELHVRPGPYPLAHPRQVTYHDPCHLARSQGVRQQPRQLLASIPGVSFVEMAEADRCCGGAGIYFLEHPQLSDRIRQDKVDHFKESGAQLLATACPACMMQLEDGLVRGQTGGQTVHWLQLLDDTYRPPQQQRRYRAALPATGVSCSASSERPTAAASG